jgi:hypothetical protein
MQFLLDAEPEELGAKIGQPPVRSPNFSDLPSQRRRSVSSCKGRNSTSYSTFLPEVINDPAIDCDNPIWLFAS